MRPSARLDRNARAENALCERRDRVRLSSATTVPAVGRCDGDAGITAEQIFQFTKHFAHNLFD